MYKNNHITSTKCQYQATALNPKLEKNGNNLIVSSKKIKIMYQ